MQPSPHIASGEEARRIMGVDPGMTATGFGVVEIAKEGEIRCLGSGVIRPHPAQPFPNRIQQVFRGLGREIEKYHPHWVAVERPFLAKNVKSAMILGQARGAAILAAAEAGLPVQELSPLEVKQAVVGYGRAAKEQVQAMVCALLRTPRELSADAADALAIALCLAHSLPWQVSLSSSSGMRPSRRSGGERKFGSEDKA